MLSLSCLPDKHRAILPDRSGIAFLMKPYLADSSLVGRGDRPWTALATNMFLLLFLAKSILIFSKYSTLSKVTLPLLKDKL